MQEMHQHLFFFLLSLLVSPLALDEGGEVNVLLYFSKLQ